MPNVYIVGYGPAYAEMFRRRGWKVVNHIEQADLIQFTGGEDVDPVLYGEARHPATYSRPSRDKDEMVDYRYGFDNKVAMAGICRGAQFLNVVNGGSLFQHVDNHAIRGTHLCYSRTLGKKVAVSSTHHQMMRPGAYGEVEGWAYKLAKIKEHMGTKHEIKRVLNAPEDVEVVWYEYTECLCFQPHPEHRGVDECRDYYFTLLEHYFDLV